MSMSPKTGVAPAQRIEFAVAMKLRLGQITSSPTPMPAAVKASCKAVVQDEIATEWRQPM